MKKKQFAVKKEQRKNETTKQTKKEKTNCALCQQHIPAKLFHKINDWARGEGNWDHAIEFIGYEKVLCIPCQVEHDIFKKKVEKTLD